MSRIVRSDSIRCFWLKYLYFFSNCALAGVNQTLCQGMTYGNNLGLINKKSAMKATDDHKCMTKDELRAQAKDNIEKFGLLIFTTRQWLDLGKPILHVVHTDDGEWQF